MTADKSKSKESWAAANREILDKLDVEAEYRALGIDVTGNQPGHSGWLPCRAFGKEDRTPSAQINVGTDHPACGRYKEFTGDARNFSLFEFAAVAKPAEFADWKAARDHYAKQTGVKLPRGGSPKAPEDSLTFQDWNDALINVWTRQHKQGILPAAVKAAGCRLAEWHKQQVIAIPVYGPHLLDGGPIGWQIWLRSGGHLNVYQGKGKPLVKRKISTVAGSRAGWMNRWALRHLDEAEIVWKVEGPSDMLSVQSIIPAADIRRHVVIANSGGSVQLPTAELIAPLAGKTVYVVHDCDVDGQRGAARWAAAIAEVAADCRNMILPYPIEDSHGCDFRDWILSGGKSENLPASARAG
ncbi:hypothetical protein LCGC14_0719130 [marine sediment metagenome]|uniref:Toprim domain-containing protein n=1 Tax=marine sediment metagenome TaxID=412755 RepID=A0A0F9TKE4_9ZZZZ